MRGGSAPVHESGQGVPIGTVLGCRRLFLDPGGPGPGRGRGAKPNVGTGDGVRVVPSERAERSHLRPERRENRSKLVSREYLLYIFTNSGFVAVNAT